MTEIRYLKQEEKRASLPLWRQAFPEDTEEFLNYYYQYKTSDNRILVLEEEEGDGRRIVSMLHRNPYKLWIQGHVIDSDYIIAVATAEDRRHRGYMRKLLTRMMEDMHRQGMPFCYLMPADKKIYEPFDFAFVYDQEHWKLTKEADSRLKKHKINEARSEACRKGDAVRAARWMELWLKQRYQVFAVRDVAYVRRLLAELESEQGWMEFLYDNGEDQDGGAHGENPVGIRCWWGVGKRVQRMLLCEEKYREDEKAPSSAIMARITDVKQCLKLLRLKKDSSVKELEVVLTVEDRLCMWNQGTFLWKVTRHQAEVTKIKEEEAGSLCLRVSVADLTQWIFGYRDPAKLSPAWNESKAGERWWDEIDVWQGVFLDEVV